MRTVEGDTRYVSPTHTKGALRRRRMARGARCWALDVKLCAVRPRRIARLTLTLRDREPLAAQHLAREFWHKVRQRWLGTQYFCWLELQRDGAVHYHALWLDPPHRRKVDLLRWVDRAWGAGRTQVRFDGQLQNLAGALDYALGYAKKMGRKRYQQLYDQVPPQLRTFMTNRLEIPPSELKKHLDRSEYVYIGRASEADLQELGLASLHKGHPESTRGGPLLEYVGELRHDVPFAATCSALDHRRGQFRHRGRGGGANRGVAAH